MKTVAIVIARCGSTRLPGKVLFNLREWPVLRWVLRAPHTTPSITETWVATSTLSQDDRIFEYCLSGGVPIYRGSETDVLSRVYECAKMAKADIIVRITADCCFADPFVIEQVIQLRTKTNADYAQNVWPATYPDGLDVEAVTFAALEAAHNEATRPSDRDCVTTYIMRNRARFKSETLINPLPGGHRERWVLDTQDDLTFCRAIAERLPVDWNGSHLEILHLLDKEPELRQINAHHPRNERYWEQIALEERPKPTRFDRSNAALRRAREAIPLGAQTFSKSYIQYPAHQAPLFVSHGDSGYIFDVDGNDFVDLVGGLLPVILGYRDPDVDEAIRRQLTNGISFSTSTEIEAELAEMLCRIIPCAEAVRFHKNGTDATTACVRLARAFTGRDYIFLSGYHGWADWSIGTTERNLGIPPQLCARFDYGNQDDVIRLSQLYGKPAGIIVEPEGKPDFLRWLKNYCDQHGIVLIYDEVITGFRWSLGGAQAWYDVIPDLAAFGKAMGNGMPISAVVGRRNIMQLYEPPDNVFLSSTFGGETLSIAAAIACIKKIEREHVPSELHQRGQYLVNVLAPMLAARELSCIQLTGHPAMTRIAFRDQGNATADQVKTLFMRSMIQEGVLVIASHNLSFAHTKPELARVVKAYEKTIDVLANAIYHGDIAQHLGDTPPIGPVSVRAWERRHAV